MLHNHGYSVYRLALIYRYKNLNTKLYNCNDNIFFNKECLTLTLVFNYVNTIILIIPEFLIQCSRQYNVQHNTMFKTIQCSRQYNVQDNTVFKTIQVLMWKYQSTLHWVRFVCFLRGVIGHTYSKKHFT
jgi:hypothetical protein